MGLKFAGGSKSAEAPDIEKGIYDMRFDGVREDELEESQFDKEVFIWTFTLFDDDGKVVYDKGEPVEVDKVTSRSTNTKSKTVPGAVKVLKALMTDKEFALFEAEEPVDADELLGRMVQGIIAIKDTGWPKVEEVLPARKAKSSRRQAAE